MQTLPVKNLSHENIRGFSLLELSFVIMMSSLLMLTFVKAYSNYLVQKRMEITNENIDAVQSMIGSFFGDSRRYPCPADRALLPDNEFYLTENCGEDLDPGQCTAGGGLCLVESDRDVDGDGTNENILIGAPPLATMREATGRPISDMASFDGWSGRLTYAVTQNLTNFSTFNFEHGVIEAYDEYWHPTAGVNGDGHYAIISHGPDGNGAFTLGGSRIPCDNPPPTVEIEGVMQPDPSFVPGSIHDENCDDDDAEFIRSLGDTRDGSEFFDDRARFHTISFGILWQMLDNEDAGGGQLSGGHVANTNTGNIGIKTSAPEQKLHVAGYTLPDGTVVPGAIRASSNTVVNEICDSDGNDCFSVEALVSDDDFVCPNGQILTGIANGAPLCTYPVFNLQDHECPPGEWVHGLSTDGTVICQ